MYHLATAKAKSSWRNLAQVPGNSQLEPVWCDGHSTDINDIKICRDLHFVYVCIISNLPTSVLSLDVCLLCHNAKAKNLRNWPMEKSWKVKNSCTNFPGPKFWHRLYQHPLPQQLEADVLQWRSFSSVSSGWHWHWQTKQTSTKSQRQATARCHLPWWCETTGIHQKPPWPQPVSQPVSTTAAKRIITDHHRSGPRHPQSFTSTNRMLPARWS